MVLYNGLCQISPYLWQIPWSYDICIVYISSLHESEVTEDAGSHPQCMHHG